MRQSALPRPRFVSLLTRAEEEARHGGVIAEPCTSRQTSGLSFSRGHDVALYSAVRLCHASLWFQAFIVSLKLAFCDFLSRFASRGAQLEADGRLLTRNEAIRLSSPSLP